MALVEGTPVEKKRMNTLKAKGPGAIYPFIMADLLLPLNAPCDLFPSSSISTLVFCFIKPNDLILSHCRESCDTLLI